MSPPNPGTCPAPTMCNSRSTPALPSNAKMKSSAASSLPRCAQATSHFPVGLAMPKPLSSPASKPTAPWSKTRLPPSNSSIGASPSSNSLRTSSPATPKSTRANPPKPASAAACKPSAAFRKIKSNSKTKTTPTATIIRRRPMSKTAAKSGVPGDRSSSPGWKSPPPDQPQREQALDPTRSILVQAPAGSGKTTLLTERFLTLLGEVDEPGQVVAITFTNAAAAEMRNRILDELRAEQPSALARRALERSHALGWRLLDLPAQLRISTIDSFCRELALQQPLLSGLGGGLAIAEQPDDLYRRAARQTLERIGQADPLLSQAIEDLLLWRDNNWQELENQLVEMLKSRDRWMHDFLLVREPDWDSLRERLERPFANAVREAPVARGD